MRSDAHFLNVFSEVARQHAHRVALEWAGKPAATYGELDDWARSIGAELIERGVEPESIVGIAIEKSPAYIASMLGIWYAGAAFVPMDPTLPPERLAFIAKECAMKYAIVGDGIESAFSGVDVSLIDSAEIGHLDGRSADAADAQKVNASKRAPARDRKLPAPSERTVESLAYVIFTSGSTGQPKGVLITHRGIVSFLSAQIEAFELNSGSRSLFFLSTNFDASVSDIGTALLSAATLCLEPPCALKPGPDFPALIADRKITHIDIPPSVLRLLKPSEMPECLQVLIIGGEACPLPVVREWARRFRLVNVYGPTESTVCTSLVVCDADRWHRPLIGQPLPGITYHVLDEEFQPVKRGCAGELFIGGIGLARGYLMRPELTARKFVELNGARMYRTGDRVLHHHDGEYEFVGRIDRQVKVRGMLVEPEEIETRLAEHDKVARAVVIKRPIRKDMARDSLVAFIIPASGLRPTASELKAHLAQLLPRWMLPHRFEFLPEFPLTVTGKVDLNALRIKPLLAVPRSKDVAAGARETGAITKEEQALSADLLPVLTDVFASVLGAEEVSADDDFFALGGDSFAVLEAVVAAEARGVTIPPSLLVEHPRLADLAMKLAALERRDERDATANGAMRAADLRSDVALNGKWRDVLETAKLRQDAFLPSPRKILLTGAGGFLGSKLLAELLQRTSAEIVCLVRASDVQDGQVKIAKALALHGEKIEEADGGRVSVLVGDLAQEMFGLARSVWDDLVATVDSVYHCAAHVNMLLPYSALRAANIGGTLEIVRFLAQGRRKCLHYASTLSVFVATDRNSGLALEEDKLEQTEIVYGGYAQTKWAAEVMLRALPEEVAAISYYRFGLIVGDSRTGRTSDTDFLALFTRGLRSLGCVPKAPQGIAVDITPVDFAADAMAYLSLRDMHHARPLTYHIANSQSLALKDLIDAIRACGVNLEEVPPDEFIGRAKQGGDGLHAQEAAACLALCRQLGSGQRFESFRTMDLFQATDITFGMGNTTAGLMGTDIICPLPDRNLIAMYVAKSLEYLSVPA